MGEQIKAGALREQAVITLNLTQKKTLKSDFFKPYHLQETHLFLRGYENKFYINWATKVGGVKSHASLLQGQKKQNKTETKYFDFSWTRLTLSQAKADIANLMGWQRLPDSLTSERN